jgi:hypothetical protein
MVWRKARMVSNAVCSNKVPKAAVTESGAADCVPGKGRHLNFPSDFHV